MIGKSELPEKPKRLEDLAKVQVVLVFKDKSGFIVPLTPLQGAFLVRMMGLATDQETGGLYHYTDLELNNLYNLIPKEKFRKLAAEGKVFNTNP